jgi:hypothetical protein
MKDGNTETFERLLWPWSILDWAVRGFIVTAEAGSCFQRTYEIDAGDKQGQTSERQNAAAGSVTRFDEPEAQSLPNFCGPSRALCAKPPCSTGSCKRHDIAVLHLQPTVSLWRWLFMPGRGLRWKPADVLQR